MNVIQLYEVPRPRRDQYNLHDSALFSTWNHFIEFCHFNGLNRSFDYADSLTRCNKYSSRPRLDLLFSLSNGLPSQSLNDFMDSLSDIRPLGKPLYPVSSSHQARSTSDRLSSSCVSPSTTLSYDDSLSNVSYGGGDIDDKLFKCEDCNTSPHLVTAEVFNPSYDDNQGSFLVESINTESSDEDNDNDNDNEEEDDDNRVELIAYYQRLLALAKAKQLSHMQSKSLGSQYF